MNRKAMVMLAALAGVMVGCGESGVELAQISTLCEGGDFVETQDADLCIYTAPITETRFICPPELPHEFMFEQGPTVCASEDLLPDLVEEELVQRGFLDPPASQNNTGVPENNAGVPENNAGVPENNAGVPDPLCEEGQRQHCVCPDNSPGITTCQDEAWGECACRDNWSAPDFDVLQEAPLGCDEPSQLLDFSADLDNETVYAGPCLTEVLVNACPVMRNRMSYDVEVLASDRREILNRPFYEETLYSYYFGYEGYLYTWDISPEGLAERFIADERNDGTVDREMNWTYDDEGRTLSLMTVATDYLSSQSWAYDDEGKLVRSAWSTVSGEDDSREYVTTFTYRPDGQPEDQETRLNGARIAYGQWRYDEEEPTRLVFSNIKGLDGRRAEIRYTYNDEGLLESTLLRQYSLGIDENGREFTYLGELRTTTFDARGNEVMVISDNGANGFRTVAETTWDDEGRKTRQTYGDEGEAPTAIWTWTYGAQGLEQSTREDVRVGRGNLVVTTTYDPVLEKPVETIEQREGSDEILSASYYAWDSLGNQVSSEDDHDGDGVIDSRTRWVWDRAGNLLDTQSDNNADGFIEERTVNRYVCD